MYEVLMKQQQAAMARKVAKNAVLGQYELIAMNWNAMDEWQLKFRVCGLVQLCRAKSTAGALWKHQKNKHGWQQDG